MPLRATLATLALAALLGACYSPVAQVPSLAPVDTTQPMVRYKAIQGEACRTLLLHMIPIGTNSALEAIWDMKRLEGVDGYVEVTVEEHTLFWLLGTTLCTQVTAYPFTYGVEPKPLSLRGEVPAPDYGVGARPAAAPAPPNPAPAPAPAPRPVVTAAPDRDGAPARDRCEFECKRFGQLAGSTQLIQQVVADRCLERCTAGDATYFRCVTQARSAADVKECNAAPAP